MQEIVIENGPLTFIEVVAMGLEVSGEKVLDEIVCLQFLGGISQAVS